MLSRDRDAAIGSATLPRASRPWRQERSAAHPRHCLLASRRSTRGWVEGLPPAPCTRSPAMPGMGQRSVSPRCCSPALHGAVRLYGSHPGAGLSTHQDWPHSASNLRGCWSSRRRRAATGFGPARKPCVPARRSRSWPKSILSTSPHRAACTSPHPAAAPPPFSSISVRNAQRRARRARDGGSPQRAAASRCLAPSPRTRAERWRMAMPWRWDPVRRAGRRRCDAAPRPPAAPGWWRPRPRGSAS